jgi:NADH-quinone oxidoreductase subunit J
MSLLLFWLFATIMLIGAVAIIAFPNPVSSALAMVTSFVGLAALFIGLSAFFVGVIQILVYSGAIMVLFLFIIMLLDLKDEKRRADSLAPLAAGLVLVAVFFIQLVGVLSHKLPNQSAPPLDAQALSAAAEGYMGGKGDKKVPTKISTALESGSLPDVHIIGHTLFTEYNLPLQILGVLLLVSTVGVVTLSRKSAAND